MHRSSRGFTLVEMLLVVSIIVLLIAMLLPALQRARDGAREVRCMANMGQVGRATISYANTNRGEFPANRFTVNLTPRQHVTWRWLLVKGGFTDPGDLWICPNPSPTPPRSEKNVSIHGSMPLEDVISNYCYNGAAMWRWSPDGSPDGAHPHPGHGIVNEKSEITMNNVRYPSRTFLLMETRDRFPDLGDWTINWTWPDGYGVIGFWHRKGGMYFIVDGHVKWSMLLDTAIPECSWHNAYEAANFHANWPGIVNPNYLP